MQKSYEFWPTCKTNYNITCTPTITLVKLTQIHCFTSSGKSYMIRPSVQHSPTLTHSNLMQIPLLMPNSITHSNPCQMWLLRSRNKSLSTGRTDTIHTDKHTKRFSHTTGPATCPLCGGSDSAPHILLRCNNHTLTIMHINRHHHAVSLCGEEISKGKPGSAIITMDACDSEKLSDLNIEP